MSALAIHAYRALSRQPAMSCDEIRPSTDHGIKDTSDYRFDMHSSSRPQLMGHFAAPNVARLSPRLSFNTRSSPGGRRTSRGGRWAVLSVSRAFRFVKRTHYSNNLNGVYVSRRHCGPTWIDRPNWAKGKLDTCIWTICARSHSALLLWELILRDGVSNLDVGLRIVSGFIVCN